MTERPEIPADAIVLGYGPVLVFPLAALTVWLAPLAPALLAAELVRVVGGTLLCFLGGVRRGLSFRTEGGPKGAADRGYGCGSTWSGSSCADARGAAAWRC